MKLNINIHAYKYWFNQCQFHSHSAIFRQYIIIDENEYSLNVASLISSNIQILSYLKI